jgi:hypothetical protein
MRFSAVEQIDVDVDVIVTGYYSGIDMIVPVAVV